MNLPPYPEYPTLSGEKIILRQILPADLPDIVEISFYDGQPARTLEEARTMQEKIEQNYADGDSVHWGIADRSTNEIVGTCGYYRGLDQGAGELGCVLRPQFRGQGYMTPALQLAIDFGLNTIGLNRIWAATSQQNERAQQLLERLCFVKVSDLEDGMVEYELGI